MSMNARATQIMATTARAGIVLLLCAGAAAQAGVLPEDRADILYHRYSGGGVTVPPTPWMGSPMKQATSPDVS